MRPVALQGTIDTFELAEVVRLLAAGGKTGRLRLEGSRGSGSVWVADGRVVATAVDHAPLATDPAEAIFELLRFEDGSFTFVPGDEPAHPGEPADVDELLASSEAQLREWREIERVVPTTRATVVLRPELPRADVVLDKARWKIVATIGGGATVATVGDALGLGELPVSRAVKDLVELGVVELSEERVEPELPEVVVDEHATESGIEVIPDPADGHDTFEPAIPIAENGSARAQLDEFAAGFGLGDPAPLPDLDPLGDPEPVAAGGLADFGVDGGAETPFAAEPFASAPDGFEDLAAAIEPLGPPTDFGLSDDGSFLAGGGDAAEVARQLSNLSPAAARAVAAAAKATTDEEREAALAAVEQDGEEPIDRELLLRFLASVKS